MLICKYYVKFGTANLTLRKCIHVKNYPHLQHYLQTKQHLKE